MVHAPRHPAYVDDPTMPYNQMLAYLSSDQGTANWADPTIVAKVIFEVVTNASEERPLPIRLPLGSDAYGIVKLETEANLKLLEQWADVSKSTSSEEQLKSINFLKP
jgi:hypothetical protein